MRRSPTHQQRTDYIEKSQKPSRTKSWLLLLSKNEKGHQYRQRAVVFFLFAVVTLSALLTPLNASAATTATSKQDDPSWLAQSKWYYDAVSQCMGSVGSWNVSGDGKDIAAGKWFYSGWTIGSVGDGPGGFLMRGVLDDIGDDGFMNCPANDNELLRGALSHWGISATELACGTLFVRDNGTDCAAGNGGFTWKTSGSDGSAKKSAFQKYIKDKVYGGKDPALGNVANFIYYRDTFLNGCAYKASPLSSKPTGSQVYTIADPKNDGTTPAIYYVGDQKGSTDRWTTTNPNKTQTCDQLAKLIGPDSTYATKYAEWLKKNNDNGTPIPETCPEGSASTACVGLTDGTATSCIIDGIGWMVCPVLNAFAGLSDAMYGWISSVLTVAPLTVLGDDGGESSQFTAWQTIRNIANVVLVIAFIIIIFSQLTSIGITNYGVKKTLPRLIIVALAINTSFYIMAIAVDVTNIVGTGLYQIFQTLAPDADASTMNASAMVASLLAGTGGAIVAGTTVAVVAASSTISLPVLALMALPVILGVVLALLAAVATLFIRNALIVVLIVISPLAFAAYLLPNTQSMFTKWRKLFMSMLFMFPMAAVLFGGAQFAAHIIVNGDDPMSALAAIFIMAAPLAMLPWLIRSTNSVLGSVGSKLSGLTKKATSATRNATQGQIDKQKAAVLAGRRNMFGRTQKEGKMNVAQRMNNRRMSRGAEIENYKGEAQENWREMGLKGSGAAAERAKSALDEQQTHSTRKAANDSSYKLRSDRRKRDSSTEDFGFNVTSENNAIKSGAISEQLRENQSARILNNVNGVGSADTAGRESKLRTTRNEAQQQASFDQRIQTSAALSRVDQQTRTAGEVSKTAKAKMDQAFEEGVVNDVNGVVQTHRNDAADAQLRTTAATERQSAVTQQRQVADPGLLNVRLDTEASKRERNVAEQQVTRAVAEGATKLGGTQMVAGQASPADQAAMQSIVDRLKASQDDTSVATSATTSAQNVQQQEYSTELMNNAGLAVDAGGIDPRGESRVKATANAVITDATNKAISAEKSTMTRAVAGEKDGSDPESLWSIVRDKTASVERRAAAAGQIVKTAGDDDIHELFQYAGDLSEPTLDTTSRLFIQQQMADDLGGRKPVSIGAADAAALGSGNYKGTFDSKVTGRLSAGKLSPETLYATSADELKRMVEVLSNPKFAAVDPKDTPPGTGAANIAELKAQIENYKKSPTFRPASPEIAALIDQLEAEI